MLNLDLSGKTALVCGSSQGIGKATALQLAGMGAKIIVMARNEENLKKVIKELPTPKNQTHEYICADFSNPAQVKQVIHDFVQKGGMVNILVNNTGGPPGGPALAAKEEEFLSAFNNHLICNHILTQALVPGMKHSGYGRIVNIISTSVKQPIPGLGVSNTIRAAVANWSKTLSLELAPLGITVNNVLPGATNTQRLSGLIKAKSDKSGVAVTALESEMLHEIPMKRFADATEIAAAVSFLASPAASYITGINVPVDGGRTACL